MWKNVGRSCLLVLMLALTTVPGVGAEAESASIPENLMVPAQNVLLFSTHATGAQIYACTARADDPGRFEWTLKAPDAALWNPAGEQVGTHFAGPAWEGADGSSVTGKLLARADAPDPSAIPWLLLEAKSHGGNGVFNTITYIQRLDTVGGLAPAEGCDRSSAGTEQAVEYSATYAFYLAYIAEM